MIEELYNIIEVIWSGHSHMFLYFPSLVKGSCWSFISHVKFKNEAADYSNPEAHLSNDLNALNR